jgi:hypothetical protein
MTSNGRCYPVTYKSGRREWLLDQIRLTAKSIRQTRAQRRHRTKGRAYFMYLRLPDYVGEWSKMPSFSCDRGVV